MGRLFIEANMQQQQQDQEQSLGQQLNQQLGDRLDCLVDGPTAQAILSVGRHTLWRLRRRGVLQWVQIGTAIRYRFRDLLRLVQEGAE